MATQITTTAGEVTKYASAMLRRFEGAGVRRYREAVERYLSLPWWKSLFASEPKPWDFYGVLSYMVVRDLYIAMSCLAPDTVVLLDDEHAEEIDFGRVSALGDRGGE